MIAAIITSKIAPDKSRSEAVELMKRRMEKRNKDYPETKRFLMQPLSGRMDEIVYINLHPSLAALEESHKKRDTDSSYDSLNKKAREMFVSQERRLFTVFE